MILTVTLNPCIDKTLYLKEFRRGKLWRSAEKRYIAGGKGVNAARVLKHLGLPVRAFVLVGGDSGKFYAEIVRNEGIPLITYRVSQSTRMQTNIYEKKRGRWISFLEEAERIGDEDVEPLTEKTIRSLGRNKVVILSGSAPSDNLADVYRKAIREAHKREMMTVLDTYGKALRNGIKASPFMVKPNREECERLLRRKLRRATDFEYAFRYFHKKGITLVIVSLGRRGFKASFDGKIYSVKTPKIEEVNPIGSGDALAAGIVYGLVKKLPIEDVLRWGGAAGCANAAVWDAGGCTKKQIEHYLPLITIKTW